MNTSGSYIRLFLGCLKKGTIETHFLQSSKWKEDVLIGQNSLIETQFQNKTYIGISFEGVEMTHEQLENFTAEVKNTLHAYIPELQTEYLELYLFPQLLLK
jgi:hypothetical protein